MHADRTNRVVLTLVGLITLALGVGGLLAAGGVFGHGFQHRRLIDNRFARYFSDHGHWLWPAIAAVTGVLCLLILLWLIRLLFSTDRSGDIALATVRSDGTTSAAGRTTLATSALTQAVSSEVESYHGVTSVRARTIGDPAQPTLVLEVTASRRANLPGLIERIQREAIAHARTALERPQMPVKLDVTVTDKTVARAS